MAVDIRVQAELVARRKRGEVPDQLLLLEHPHVITLGRNGHLHNLLASEGVKAEVPVRKYRTARIG